MNDASELRSLAADGARTHSAPAALRLAYAEIRRQAKHPDLFAAAAIAAARSALEEDEARFYRLQLQEAARARARFHRQEKRRAKHRTYSARCCGRFYTHDDASHTYWTECLTCRQPLSYSADFVRV